MLKRLRYTTVLISILSNTSYMLGASSEKKPVLSVRDLTVSNVREFYEKNPERPTAALQLLVKTHSEKLLTPKAYGRSYIFLMQNGARWFAPSADPNEINAFFGFFKAGDPKFVVPLLKTGNPLKKFAAKEDLLTDQDIKAGTKATIAQMLEREGLEKEFTAIIENFCNIPEIKFTQKDWREITEMVAPFQHLMNQSKYARIKALSEIISE